MTSFANCGDTQQTLLILLLFAALLLQYLLVIENAVARRYVRSIPDSLLFLSELCLLSMLLAVDGGAAHGALRIPAAFLALLETVMLVYAVVSGIRFIRRMRHSLSRESIKEGVDNLPDGVCFFDEDGAVRLINQKMLLAGIQLFGSEIQTLEELHTALLNPLDAVERLDDAVSLYRFPDGTVRRFAERTILDRDGGRVTEVVATDVTRLYAEQAKLNRENARLADANRRMKRILDNMSEIVREEEILSMKMRVHDDIGHTILSARKALLQQHDIAVIHENAALWEKAVALLDRANHMPPPADEWETVQTRAGRLGVEIEVDGALPEYESLRHLLILAVRECVTNCVRHAGGNRVFMEISYGEKEITCVITNNGKAPEHSITEGGGLSSLRRRIERAGGIMQLKSNPRFALIVVLPEKEAA